MRTVRISLPPLARGLPAPDGFNGDEIREQITFTEFGVGVVQVIAQIWNLALDDMGAW